MPHKLLSSWSVALLAISVFCSPFCSAREHTIRDDYDLTVKVVLDAVAGQKLFAEENFISHFNGGHYTDPIPKNRGYEFWSDGRLAKLDRDSDGHHESLFAVEEGKLIYIGSIGSAGTFVDVARPYAKLLNRSVKLLKLPAR